MSNFSIGEEVIIEGTGLEGFIVNVRHPPGQVPIYKIGITDFNNNIKYISNREFISSETRLKRIRTNCPEYLKQQ